MEDTQQASSDVTSQVYCAIRDGLFSDAIITLQSEVQLFPDNPAALSLLGFCYFHIGQYDAAANTYATLHELQPNNAYYQQHLAHCLYKAGCYDEATFVTAQLPPDDTTSKLRAAILYEQNNLKACHQVLEASSAGDVDVDVAVNMGCLKFREGRYEEARQAFSEVVASHGASSDLSYNIALCHFRQKQYAAALKLAADIIAQGVREHPELGVGSTTGGVSVRSVGNSQLLRSTALIEAFNLKAAVELALGNTAAAREALTDMPPRKEDELDPVTLHNSALVDAVVSEPHLAMQKLVHLLKNPPFPRETFANLLLLYCRNDLYDVAAEEMASNPELSSRFLAKDVAEFLEAVVLRATSPEEAFQRLDTLADRHVERLRRVKKQIADARTAMDAEAAKHYLAVNATLLEKYVPVVMAMASIYWELDNFAKVQQILSQAAEFCSESDVWKLNMAHCLFMQEGRWAEATRFYEPIARAAAADLLAVPAIVLANLCVCYIMANNNKQAEVLMQKVEEAEDKALLQDPSRQLLHSCIINLVIGTLYCCKGNHAFGLSRVLRSLDPLPSKLSVDTWHYAKRCIVALLDHVTKQMVVLKVRPGKRDSSTFTCVDSTQDASVQELQTFLVEVESYGKELVVYMDPDTPSNDRTAAMEARLIRAVLVQL